MRTMVPRDGRERTETVKDAADLPILRRMDRHLGCSMSASLLTLVRLQGGADAVARVLAEAGTPHDERYLEDAGNWISVDEGEALLRAAAKVTEDPAIARRVGEHFVSRHAGT